MNGKPLFPVVGIEQLSEQAAAHPMGCGANSHFARLQIEMPVSREVPQNALRKPLYFLRSLPANRFCSSFFSASSSCGSFTSGTGRNWQIRSFVATTSRQSRTNRR